MTNRPSEDGFSISSHEQEEKAQQIRIDRADTFWFKRNLVLVMLVMFLLGIGEIVNGVVGHAWYDFIAAAAWLLCGLLSFRLLRQLRKNIQVTRAVDRVRWILVGLSVFLLGVGVLVLGNRFAG